MATWSRCWPVTLQSELKLTWELAMLARAWRLNLVEREKVMWKLLMQHVPPALMGHVVTRHDEGWQWCRVAAEARGGGHGHRPMVGAGTVGGSIPWLSWQTYEKEHNWSRRRPLWDTRMEGALDQLRSRGCRMHLCEDTSLGFATGFHQAYSCLVELPAKHPARCLEPLGRRNPTESFCTCWVLLHQELQEQNSQYSLIYGVISVRTLENLSLCSP
jgi:hypothetical protein